MLRIIVVSILGGSNGHQEDSWSVVENLIYHSPEASKSLLSVATCQADFATFPGLVRFAIADNTNDRIWSIFFDHIRRVDYVEIGCSVLLSKSQDRQGVARMLG